MNSSSKNTDTKILQTSEKKPDLRVYGVVEKRWGQLMCGHGHEGAVSRMKLPDFPQ